MASEEDIKRQLKATEQLTAAIEKQQRKLEATTRELTAQYEIFKKIQEAVQAAGDLGDPLKKAKESQKAVEDLGKEIEKSGDHGKELTESLQKGMDKAETSTKNFTEALKKAGKQFPVFKTTALAATSGVIEAFRFATSMTSMLFKGITTLIGGFAKLGVSIISIPFKIFDNLVKKAEAGGGGNELAAAYEAVRKQFGDFKQDAAHNVLETAHTIDKEFTQTGLNTWRVFGNLAERIQLVNKVATAMGATFDVVGKEMSEHAGHILAYQKGLGVADENMKDFAQAAIAAGKPMQEVMRETASLSLSMQKQFGGSAKLYSRDMSKMINDVKHFGGVSQKVMVETAVYTRKLGVETDKLLASLDKFDTFESAAESAAKLAQTYGVQIDAFKLMSAESPAEQADMIKKAFQQQGIAVDQLDRKNMKYIASLTGWDEATSKALLSNKNMGVSLDKIKDGSALAEKQQLSQADAMKQLAGAIERLTPSGGSGFGGFIKALLKGFNDGVEWSKEFRQIMINIRIDLWKMWQAGFKIGQEFVKAFPGIKEFFGGIGELFNPARFQKLADGIVSVFKNFFANLTTNPKTALPQLLKELREKFFDFLNGEKPGGSKILDGLKKFSEALKHILAGSIKFIMENLRDGFKLITDLMSGKGLQGIGAGATGAKKMMIEFMTPIFEAVKEAWPGLRDAFIGMLTTAWDKIKQSGLIEKLWDGLKKYMLVVGLTAIGSGAAHGGGAFLMAMAGRISGSIITGVVGKVFDNVGKAAAAKAASSAATAAKGVPVNTSGMPDFNKIFDSKQGGISADSAKGMSGAAKELDAGGKQGVNWSGIAKFLVGIAGVIAIGMVALWAGIKLFGDIPMEKILKGLAVVAGVSAALLPAAGAIALLSKVPVDIKSAALGILAVGGAVVVMTGAMGLMYAAFAKAGTDMGNLKAFSTAVLEMSKVFAMTGLVVMEAMVIGAVIAATGSSAAAAAAIGFAAIATGVTSMAGAVVLIMKSLEGVNVASGLKEKTDIFVNILQAVTGFAGVFANILESLRPSFGQLLFGPAKDTVKDVQAVTDFVKTMVGPPGGMIDLVGVLIKAVADLAKGDEKTLQAAHTLSGLMSAVATMAGAIVPPKELFTNGFKLIETGDATRNAIQGSADYVKTMESSLGSLMERIKSFVSFIQQKGLTKEDLAAVGAIGPMFSSIATLTQALSIPPELVNVAKNEKGDVQGNVMNQIGDIVRAKGLQIQGVITSMSEAMNPIIKAMGSLTPQQVESMKVFVPVITTLFSMVTGLSASFTGILLSKNINTDLNTRSALITRMITSSGEMIKGVGDQLPAIMTSLTSMPKIAEKGAMAETKASLKVVRDMIGELNSITNLLSNDKIMKIDVGGKLTELSKRVGLGGEGTYTITHKPITITVNLSVQMDAKDIEYGIVNRNGPGGKIVVTYDEKARKDNI